MIIKAPEGSKGEITSKRTFKGKVFDMGETPDGRKKFHQGIAIPAIHVPSDFAAFNAVVTDDTIQIRDYTGAWDDGDCNIVFDSTTGVYKTGNTYYALEIDPAICGYKYVSKRGGDVEVSLKMLDDAPVGAMPTVKLEDNRLLWDKIVLGLNIEIYCTLLKVQIIQTVLRSSAPHKFEWEVKEGNLDRIRVSQRVRGADNANETGRVGETKQRALEIIRTKTPPVTVAGKQVYRVIEEATKRVTRIDPVTRVRTLGTDIRYPLVMKNA